MKKLFLSSMVLVIASMASYAQSEKKFSFSAGAELGFASGSFNNTHSVGLGGSLQAEYYVMEKLKATALFGIINYAGKSSILNPDKAAQRIIPLRLGAKYFLAGGFYGGAQLGVAFFSNYAQYSGTGFAYSPLMLGYEFRAKENRSFDVTLKYDGYTGTGGGTLGSLGVRVAYVF